MKKNTGSTNPGLVLRAAAIILLAGLAATFSTNARAQDANAQNQDAPFFRFSKAEDTGQHRLHGKIKPGTEVMLMGQEGACLARVSKNMTLDMMQGPTEFSTLIISQECQEIGPIFAGTTVVNDTYEPQPFTTVYGDFPADEFFPAAKSAVAENSGLELYDFAKTSKPLAHLLLKEEDLNFVLYECSDIHGGATFQDGRILVAFFNGSAQAFELGCQEPTCAVFKLDGQIYVSLDWNCCACGGDSFAILRFNKGAFFPVLSNWDFDA